MADASQSMFASCGSSVALKIFNAVNYSKVFQFLFSSKNAPMVRYELDYSMHCPELVE